VGKSIGSAEKRNKRLENHGEIDSEDSVKETDCELPIPDAEP
jgi:hypothetical protein